ncbi:MAG: hypothetical protein A2283_06090 [Lentisphaerae bacterium RIFOXYA12_FULL_48_11]|nr:MAG: hypothetical protein A2283_06090 [Lentisphaerae bacterium RIFOXYA12_FULL_48_11]
MDSGTNITQVVQHVVNTANSVADAVNNVTTAGQYAIGWIAGLVGMLAHHMFLITLAVRFIVIGIVMGILWHVGWNEYHSGWDFAVASVFLVGLGAICANVGKAASAFPIVLPFMMLIDAGCFAFVDWFIPGMSSVRPIVAPLMYSFILLVIQIPLNYTPA